MKILIATSLAGSWPYIPEMLEEFRKRGQQVEVFDICDCQPRGFATKVAFRISKLRYPARIAILKATLTSLSSDFDAVNIHFAEPIYRHLAPALRLRGKKLITSIWGSDLLRAGPSALRDLGHTMNASDIVTTNNPEILQKIVSYYPEMLTRARIVPFGLRSLDVIAALQQSESLEESRRKLNVPSGKLVVTCGYNAIPEQRHAMMIQAVARVSVAAKSRLFVLIPMTYPDNKAYRDEIRKLIKATEIECRILDEKLTIQDVARLRIVSDYVVNVQTTDSLSASIQEHLFAGSSVIVGKWLPYGFLERMGISLRKIENVDEITDALEKAALVADVRRVMPVYADEIYNYSSWSSNARRWLQLYREDYTEVGADPREYQPPLLTKFGDFAR